MNARNLAAIVPFITLAGLSAQTITTVTPSAFTRRDRVILEGSGFGAEQGGSRLLIGGAPAIVTFWSDAKIRAHVPPGTPVGPTTIEVVTIGSSGPRPIEILPDPAPEGRIKWRIRTDHFYSLARPAVAPDGTIYAVGVAGPLYAVDPRGFIKWTTRGGGVRPPAVGADGTVYYSGGGATITAANPEGEVIWRFTAPDNAGTTFVGPNVGPDGKIYAVTEEEPSLGTDFGAFALHPDGTLAWNTSGGYNFRHAPYGWEIAFSSGRLFFATGQGFPLTGNPGVHALEADDGDELWTRVGISSVQSDAAGSLYWLGAINNNYIGSYTPAGDERWVLNYLRFQAQPGRLVVSPNGTSFYSTNSLSAFAAINTNGDVLWELASGSGVHPYGAIPDNSGAIVVEYQNNPRERRFQERSAVDGSIVWEQLVPFEDEVWMDPSWDGRFSPDGRTFYAQGAGNNTIEDPYSYLYAIEVGDPCPADYNDDGDLTSQDFFDFLIGFFSGAADFNADGVTNSQDLFDYLAAFFAGC